VARKEPPLFFFGFKSVKSKRPQLDYAGLQSYQNHRNQMVDPCKLKPYNNFGLNRPELLLKFLLNFIKTKTDMLLRNALGTIGFCFTLLAAIAAGFAMASAASVEVPRISVEKTRELLGSPDVIIIDVRTAKTWWRSPTKILSAVREEPGTVEKWAGKYPKDKTLILYCA
jgi:hypothetical protein